MTEPSAPQTPPSGGSGTGRRRPGESELPPTLRWAVWLLFGQAGALSGVTVYLLIESLTGRAANIAVAIGLTVFAAAGVAAMIVLGRALSGRRAGARGPAIVLQLLLLPVAFYMIQGGLTLLGVALLILGLTVPALLVSPPTTRALGLR